MRWASLYIDVRHWWIISWHEWVKLQSLYCTSLCHCQSHIILLFLLSLPCFFPCMSTFIVSMFLLSLPHFFLFLTYVCLCFCTSLNFISWSNSWDILSFYFFPPILQAYNTISQSSHRLKVSSGSLASSGLCLKTSSWRSTMAVVQTLPCSKPQGVLILFRLKKNKTRFLGVGQQFLLASDSQAVSSLYAKLTSCWLHFS